MSTKQERVEQANDLIRVISAHGRRFFYNKTHDRIAHIELCDRGRVYWVDDYTGRRVYTHNTAITSRWRGFSHGGTLRSLAERMRDYIVHGQHLPRGVIAPERSFTDGDIWGYGPEAAAVRQAAFALPIMQQERQQ